MMRRTSGQSYSKVSIGMEENERRCDDICLSAEPVVVVAAAQESASLPDAAHGLSWTDNCFQEYADIVAVFDYDLKIVEEIKIDEKLEPWGALLVLVSFVYYGCLWSIFAGMLWVIFGSALLSLAIYACIESAKQHVRKSVDNVWTHTAVTRTGVRHVQPSTPDRPGYALDIPFEDVLSIKIQRLPNAPMGVMVQLTLASTDDGLDYITSGFCQFRKHARQIQLGLIGLKEPVRFKKLVEAMKDKLSTVSSKGAQLLSRVEAFLDSDFSLDPDVNQVLSELVIEMRAFNKTSSISGEPHAATIV